MSQKPVADGVPGLRGLGGEAPPAAKPAPDSLGGPGSAPPSENSALSPSFDQGIHQWFEAQAARTPDTVAVEFEDQRLSYRELNKRAGVLAQALRETGVGPDTVVGLCVKRSLEMAVGLLGILKAGGAYVPLDPAYPRERINFMLTDSAVPVLVTQRSLTAQLPPVRPSLVYLEDFASNCDLEGACAERTEPNSKLDTPNSKRLSASPLAYVIYTSGSTGQPKGVLIPHRALVNHSTVVANLYELRPGDRVLQFASLSFDVAAEEIFPAWLSGATVVLRPNDALGSIAGFLQFVERQRITVLNLPASYWRELVAEMARTRLALPACVRLVITGNERVSLDTYATWHQLVGDRVRWLNAYGPTETTITATVFDPRGEGSEVAQRVLPVDSDGLAAIRSEDTGLESPVNPQAGKPAPQPGPRAPASFGNLSSVPIGRPLAHVKIYLLDEQRQPVRDGEPGEIHIGGAGLARGYLNRPEQTAARFIADPFSREPGARLYKTGDRGRFLPDGNLEFLGRFDEQVKIRGFRVELGEIETALRQHPQIRQAVVLAREDNTGGHQLVAYVVLQQPPAPSAIEFRNFLHERLPDFMQPAAFVFLEALPLLPNGKLDRRALPEPGTAPPPPTAMFVAPRNSREEILAGLWSEVLGVKPVGIHDHFFDLGGHSLHATQIVSRIREAFGVELSLRSFFEAATIAGVADRLATCHPADQPPPPMARVSRAAPLPLSFAQQRLWFLDQLEPGSCAYNMPEGLRLTGPLHVAALEHSLSEIVRRHEVLRTIYTERNGEPVQIIQPAAPVKLTVVDMRAPEGTASTPSPISGAGGTAASPARAEAQRPFDLTRDPMLRAKLLCLGENDHCLLLTFHHIAADAWSVNVLYQELAALYTSFVAGARSALPEPPVQYADFAVWQRDWLQGEVLKQELAYWKQNLGGRLPVLELPADHPRPAVQTYGGASQTFLVPGQRRDELSALGRREGTTLFMTLLAAFQVWLHRTTEQDDLVVGTPIAGRNRVETERLLGCFINTLALRANLAGNPTFRELLGRVRESTLGAFAHQELPFERLVEELAPDRDPSHSPVFQVMFALQNAPAPSLTASGLSLRPQECDSGTALFDLTLEITEAPEGLTARLTYNTDLFEPATVARMQENFLDLLERLTANPELRLAELPRYRPAVDPAEIESALRADASVLECAVLEKQTSGGTREWVAFVVTAGAFSPEHCHARLKALLPAHKLPRAYVPVTALPLTTGGQLDEPTLRELEVMDEDLRQRWEERLRSVPEIKQVAVVVREEVKPRLPLHLAQLLPGWQQGGMRGDPPSARPAGTSASASATPSEQSPHEDLRAPAQPPPGGTAGVQLPAIADGGLLRLASDAPRVLGDFLQRAAATSDHGLIFLQPDGSERATSYRELWVEAQRLLTGLRRLGLKPQDKVIFQCEHNQDFFAAFWSCVLGGFVPVPIAVAANYEPANSTVKKLRHAWELLERPLVLTGQRLAPAIRRLAETMGLRDFRVATVDELRANEPDPRTHPSQPEDLTLLMLTSGSTGMPKLVMLSHRNLVSRTLGSVQLNGFTRDEVTLNWMPLDHVAGIIYFHLRDVHLQCRQVHAPSALVLENPLRWLDWMERHRVTVTFAPNFAFGLVNDRAEEIARRRWDLSSVRFVLNGGEAIVARTARRFLKLLAPHGLRGTAMHPAWGMAETSSGTVYSRWFSLDTTTDNDPFVEVGVPIPGDAFRVVDDDQQVLPEAAIGRIQVKGLTVTAGYYGHAPLNREVFTPDGWFDTGDLGWLRQGRLTITGRKKEIIIIHGVNYYSHEVEAVVEDVPGVQVSFTAACAMREPDSDTDSLAIFFSPASDEETRLPTLVQEIRRRVMQETGANPAFVVPVRPADVPKTSLGKIQRSLLQQRFERGEFEKTLQRLEVLSGNANTVPDWFYEKVWQRKELRRRKHAVSVAKDLGKPKEATDVTDATDAVSVPEDLGKPKIPTRSLTSPNLWGSTEPREVTARVLLLADALGLGAALREQWGSNCVVVEAGEAFAELSDARFRINPREPADYERLWSCLDAGGEPPRKIIHLWTYGETAAPATSAAQLEQAQERGLFSVLFLAQALAKVPRRQTPVELLVVSSVAQATTDKDAVACEHAPLLGLLKTIPQELTWLRCRHVDLEAADAASHAQRILDELEIGSPDAEVAYRTGQRRVPVLRRIQFDASPAEPLPFKANGFYLISGGLGGIGAEVAKFLLQHFQARLLLLGQATVAERSQAFAALANLGGEVMYLAADVGDLGQVQSAVAQAKARWDCELDGVIHLAGAAGECPLLEETRDRLLATLRPKLTGTWVLHQLVKDQPGALFVSFSSVNAFFGGANFGAYAAANRFLESFAPWQRQHSRLRSYCLSWSMWDEIGMNRSFTQKEAARAHGFHSIQLQQGLHSLLVCLRRGLSHGLIGLEGGHPFIRPHTTPDRLNVQLACAYFTAAGDTLSLDQLAALDVRDRFGTRSRCDFVRREQMPVTAAGDVDRAWLANPDASAAARRVAPRTETEARLAQLWRELLGVAEVGVHDNFFALGGHSLLATQLISRVRQSFQVDLPLPSLFAQPTIAALAGELEKAPMKAAPQPVAPIKAIVRQGEFPVSYAQERLWFIDRLMPGTAVYNIPSVIRLRGRLQVAALEQCFQELIRRHETLRTTFRMANEAPVQVVAVSSEWKLPVADLVLAPGEERETKAQQWAVQECRHPFDLEKGTLLRAHLLRLADDDHVLAVTLHHIISDGWSHSVFVRELAALYESFVRGAPATLPALAIQYADYAQWQREWLRGDVLEQQLAYWKQQLGGGVPVLQLPTDRPRPAVQTFHGRTQSSVLPATLLDALQQLSQREGATLFMTLLAALKVLLHRYTGQEDIAVGTPIANRNRVETEGLIGYLANTLVLRSDLAGQPTFRELLRRVREVALGAYAHQDLPFEKLVEALNPVRDLSHQPLFEVMFVLQNMPREALRLPGLTLSPLEVDLGVAMFDLTLYLEETESGLKLTLEYNSDLFDAETMERLAGHYRNLLESIVANPAQALATLPMLPAAERHQLLVEVNHTRTDYPRHRCIHELFEEQTVRAPEAVALEFEGERLSYRAVNERANRLAHYLRQQGVGAETLVGLCLERSLNLVVALLGILKAGGAYVPLDPAYPPERLALMLADSGVSVLVTEKRLLTRLPEASAKLVCLDLDAETIARGSAANPPNRTAAESVAYVMYTSGSTGRPKGVCVPHRGVVRLVQQTNYVRLAPDEVFLQFAPISFDASTFEIWGGLLNGARLVVMPPHTPTLEELGRAIRQHGITTLWLSAELFRLMVEERLADLAGVRQLLAGGDVLPVAQVNRVLAAKRNFKLINGYGPTESTTFACCFAMDPGMTFAHSVPIGRPVSNTEVYVLDRQLQPVPIGVTGELYLGGDGLARGYWQRPELNAEKFIPHPFSTEPGARLYRTGDLVRYRTNGLIEFLGRRDRQVKIRGFRIELAEVETALEQHPNIARAVALVREDEPGQKRLAVCCVPKQPPAPTVNDLRHFLKQKLPEYMVPSLFGVTDALPLTPSGKVDALALPAPDGARADAAKPIVGPHDLLEAQLIQTWERVLGVKSIGVTDNFFDLGGHSLLAVRLFVQIEKVLGQSLPLATLFQAPTIEQLAAVLRHKGWVPPWSSLVAIQSAGTRPPLFIIHGIGGNVLNFHDLAKHLGEDQPVYGLQSPGLDGKRTTPKRVEDMAAHYIQEIRTLLPNGPFHLAGMSFGGVVAYEMAQQLHAQELRVGLLALLDSYPLGHSELRPITERTRQEMHFWTRRLQSHWRDIKALRARDWPGYLRKKSKTLRRRLKSKWWQLRYKLNPTEDENLPTVLQDVKESNFLAARGYVTRPYPGPITLFLASEQSPADVQDLRTTWSKLALGGVETHEIPGNHVTLTEEPHVRVLAKVLRQCLAGFNA